ncbi:LuxR family transcriptional regulator [Kitasatospora sp. GP82]|uniref:helix-turn-helix transcriptional regulator n=1 Tax=Kitasatospora sp. GP82 TaxID=3035089 RepID=UPI002474A561|nr:LuxR family transcriptional regulator [Kitasatospora sp. GP82]
MPEIATVRTGEAQRRPAAPADRGKLREADAEAADDETSGCPAAAPGGLVPGGRPVAVGPPTVQGVPVVGGQVAGLGRPPRRPERPPYDEPPDLGRPPVGRKVPGRDSSRPAGHDGTRSLGRSETRLPGRGELLASVGDLLQEHGALLLYGPAGIGKSAVVAAIAAQAAGSGTTVLRCAPADQETRLPFVGLIDLLSTVRDACFDTLPAGPRGILRAALLRGEGPADDRSRLALRVAVAEVLRSLAGRAPVLLVLDGLQWLDAPSAEVLSFLARRARALGLSVLATERTPEEQPPQLRDLCPPGAIEMPVPPLAPTAIGELLARECGGQPATERVREIQQASAGNPLYALELARAGRHHPPGTAWPPNGPLWPVGPAAVPKRLRALLLDRVRVLSAETARVLLLVAAASRPTSRQLRAAGVLDPMAALAEAQGAGALDTDADGTVRFRHPLLRAAILAEAAPRDRLAAHRALAAAAQDPVERARQLALARPEADENVARVLLDAAATACRRGTPEAAYELAALAAARTPAAAPWDRGERLLRAAEYACDAGLWEEARRAVRPLLAEPTTPSRYGSAAAGRRLRARTVLLRASGPALDGAAELIAEGLAEAADDPLLQAPLYYWSAARELLGGRTAEAADQARWAAELATRAGDTATGAASLGLLAEVQALRAEPVLAERSLARALALAAGDGPRHRALLRRQALLDLDADRPDQARQGIAALLDPIGPGPRRPAGRATPGTEGVARGSRAVDPTEATEPADSPASPGHRRPGARRAGTEETTSRGRSVAPAGSRAAAGDGMSSGPGRPAGGTGAADRVGAGGPVDSTEASAALSALVRLCTQLGECDLALSAVADCAPGDPAPAMTAVALAELAGGERPRAVERALAAVHCATRSNDRLSLVHALDVLGRAQLLAGDPASAAKAVEALQRARALGAEMELADPGTVRRLGALAEGLVTLGEPAEAMAVIAGGRTLLARTAGGPEEAALPRTGPSATAVLDRAEGLLLASLGHGAEAAPLLRAAAARLGELRLPLEAAATLVALGGVERRARRRAAARAALGEAREICLAHGARPLLERVERDLDRLVAGDRVGPESVELTAGEHRVAELVAGGATNREVAAALFVSVKTVEGTLSRVYRKLGVRSRTSLARTLVMARTPGDTDGSYNRQGQSPF